LTFFNKLKNSINKSNQFKLGKKIIIFNGDWGLGIGDWGLGIGPNPQSPIPNPQSPIPIIIYNILLLILLYYLNKKLNIS